MPCRMVGKMWFLVAMLLCSSCDTSAKLEKPTLNLQTTKLAVIPKESAVSLVIFDDQGRQAAYVVKKDDKHSVVVGNRAGKAYTTIESVVFSPDGKSIAYSVKDNGKEFIVVNGKEGKHYDGAANPVISPDGWIVAYEAQKDAKNNKWCVVANGKEGPEYDMLNGPPAFSPDSRMLSYIGQDFAKKKYVRIVSNTDMKNPKIGKEYDWIGGQGPLLPVISPVGDEVAYGAAREGKFFVVRSDFALNREDEGPPYDWMSYIVFSPDGKRLAYGAGSSKNDCAMVVDGRQGRNYEKVWAPVFSPDSSKLAYVTVLQGKWGITVEGSEDSSHSYDQVTPPVFSPDGKMIAYGALKGTEWRMVINGKEGPPYEMVVTPLFSPDGTRLIYRARKNGKRFVVVADRDGVKHKDHQAYEAVWQPRFSPDGKLLAYGAVNGQEILWRVEPIE